MTAEYNRSIPAVLKNALDYVYGEWNRKPAAFVGYGAVGAARAVEHLRLIAVELQMAPTRTGVHITMEPFLAVHAGPEVARRLRLSDTRARRRRSTSSPGGRRR